MTDRRAVAEPTQDREAAKRKRAAVMVLLAFAAWFAGGLLVTNGSPAGYLFAVVGVVLLACGLLVRYLNPR